ncbi:hypothetical protein JOF28_000546 [Leucobacter exalbidus]|uniref:Uncharacterized protein n=1 Tax=Leucobacter exalbidus TaxID=662960 RepID=A0A940PU41_9MICO|nr:Ish1 domain-containing protein [Leucobacter exalbidus]MBP1325314.1 hypothetical protein [Leucobacter exalbidus]
MTAREAAALPSEERPAWYRPPKGAGNGSPPAEAFSDGNVEQLGPGHRSPRVYSRIAAALVGGLIEQRPDLATYPESLASWSDSEARAALLRAYLDEHGMLDDTGEARETLLRQLDRFERRAADARQRLGLDPRSEAELALLRARAMREGQLAPTVDLSQLAEMGRAALDSSDPVRAALDRVRAEAANTALAAESIPNDEDTERPTI